MSFSLQDDETRYEYQRVLRCVHRQIIKNARLKHGYVTTVGEVSESLKIKPETIAMYLKNAWLIILTEDGSDVTKWLIEEDGE